MYILKIDIEICAAIYIFQFLGMDHRVCFCNDGSKCNGSAIVKPLLSVLFIVSYFVFTFL